MFLFIAEEVATVVVRVIGTERLGVPADLATLFHYRVDGFRTDSWAKVTFRHKGGVVVVVYLTLEDESDVWDVYWVRAFYHGRDGGDEKEVLFYLDDETPAGLRLVSRLEHEQCSLSGLLEQYASLVASSPSPFHNPGRASVELCAVDERLLTRVKTSLGSENKSELTTVLLAAVVEYVQRNVH